MNYNQDFRQFFDKTLKGNNAPIDNANENLWIKVLLIIYTN